MAGKLSVGTNVVPNDFTLARAYCEGRHAAAIGEGTNPHTSGTPEYIAWGNGNITYEGVGTNIVSDHCAEPKKLITRVIAATPTLLVVDVTCTPDLPLTYTWGDGTSSFAATGDTSHTYSAAGTYTIKAYFQNTLFNTLAPVTVAATLIATRVAAHKTRGR